MSLVLKYYTLFRSSTTQLLHQSQDSYSVYNCKTLNLIHYKCTYKNIYVYEYMLHITGETQLSLLLSTIVSHKAQPETLFKDKIWNFIEHVIDNPRQRCADKSISLTYSSSTHVQYKHNNTKTHVRHA